MLSSYFRLQTQDSRLLVFRLELPAAYFLPPTVLYRRMWRDLLGSLWRGAPRGARVWGVWLANAHFTVTVGAVARDTAGRVLLFNHVFRKGSGWGIPGGFMKQGEQPDEALRRELCEESGLELSEVELAFVRTHARPRQLEIIFRCRVSEGAVPSLNSEIRGVEWYEPDKLPPELSRDQRRLIKRALEGGTPGRD